MQEGHTNDFAGTSTGFAAPNVEVGLNAAAEVLVVALVAVGGCQGVEGFAGVEVMELLGVVIFEPDPALVIVGGEANGLPDFVGAGEEGVDERE